MVKGFKLGGCAVVSMILVSTIVYARDDIGFKTRTGGVEYDRQIQENIRDSLQKIVTKQELLSVDMAKNAANLEKLNISLQALQRSIDSQILVLKAQYDTAKEQRDLLNIISKYLLKEQQLSQEMLNQMKQGK